MGDFISKLEKPTLLRFETIFYFMNCTTRPATDSGSDGIDDTYQDKSNNFESTPITPSFAHLDESGVHRKIQVTSNWTTFDEQPLTGENIAELFSNTIPAIRYPKLLSTEECARLVEIIKAAQVVSSFTYL